MGVEHRYMKKILFISLIAISVLGGTSVAYAHHNSPANPDIGDAQGMHEAAISRMLSNRQAGNGGEARISQKRSGRKSTNMMRGRTQTENSGSSRGTRSSSRGSGGSRGGR